MKFSDLKIIQRESGTAILVNGGLEVAQIACNGNDDVKSYPADALEAAELLKQFFEAKEAGKLVRLFVEDKALSPMGTVIGPNPHHEPPNVYERIRDRVHMKAERHARQQIAHMATQIFAHGGYTSHAAAVDDAAYIWRLSQQVEL